MPIYEYECSVCDSHFEKKQNFHEEPVTTCPTCQGKVRRVLHPVPVIFKGSGFYTTDNRKGKDIEPVKGERKTPGKKKKEDKEGESAPATSH